MTAITFSIPDFRLAVIVTGRFTASELESVENVSAIRVGRILDKSALDMSAIRTDVKANEMLPINGFATLITVARAVITRLGVVGQRPTGLVGSSMVMEKLTSRKLVENEHSCLS